MLCRLLDRKGTRLGCSALMCSSSKSFADRKESDGIIRIAIVAADNYMHAAEDVIWAAHLVPSSHHFQSIKSCAYSCAGYEYNFVLL